jgi:hypothetical protein
MTLPAKLWIDTLGNSIPVGDDLSHEEWANAHGYELEDLLSQGWCRIQNVPPPYLLIDFQLPVNAAQAKAVSVLFQNRLDQIVVEYQGEAKSFKEGEGAERHVLVRK